MLIDSPAVIEIEPLLSSVKLIPSPLSPESVPCEFMLAEPSSAVIEIFSPSSRALQMPWPFSLAPSKVKSPFVISITTEPESLPVVSMTELSLLTILAPEFSYSPLVIGPVEGSWSAAKEEVERPARTAVRKAPRASPLANRFTPPSRILY